MILPCLAWEFWKYIDGLVIAELFSINKQVILIRQMNLFEKIFFSENS